MRVFISWSKARSRIVAQALSDFIDGCIQAARPWTSNDTAKGAAWQDAILSKLDEAVLGIVCLTRENQREPWLLFEGGALAKQKVLHVLSIDMPNAEIELPFGMYQVTQPNKEELLKLLHTINQRLPEGDRRSDKQLGTACGIDPVSWTPRNARNCARSVSWHRGSEEFLHPSSRQMLCACAAPVIGVSAKSPRTWTWARQRYVPGSLAQKVTVTCRESRRRHRL